MSSLTLWPLATHPWRVIVLVMTTETDTATDLQTLETLFGSKAFGYFDLGNGRAGDAMRAGIDALLMRDLQRAAELAGQPKPKTPVRYLYQAAYRDYYGYEVEDERTALWICKWAEKYLGAKDTRVQDLPGGKFHAVTQVAKVAD